MGRLTMKRIGTTLMVAALWLTALAQHPRLNVSEGDRQDVWQKIRTEPWAATVYDGLKDETWERGEGNAPVPTVRMPGMRTWNKYQNVPLAERTPYNETGVCPVIVCTIIK